MADQAIFGQAKLLNHPEKILAWMQSAAESLVTVEIDLTNRCNNLCPGCAGGRATTAAELTFDEAIVYLEDLCALGAKGVIFTGGGEPLLHPRALDVIRYAKLVCRMDVGLITNGLVLAAHPELSEELVHLCTWIRISLDADGPEMYQATHGVNRYYAVVAAIAYLVTCKQEQAGAIATIGVGFLTGPATVGGMEGFLQVATELEVDYAQFRPFHGDDTDIRPEYERLKALYPVATASIQKYDHFDDAVKRPYTECHGRHFTTVIGADANVYVCCHMRGIAKYAIGNLRVAPLATVWAARHHVPIDFADCPLFCRADEFNRMLFELKKPKTHVNFL
jgi:MoaA/NifB/PqqE/SkfB family radical SAM enzyme